MPSAPWTILKLIRWTDERFRKEGLNTPRLDAEVLLAETLGVDRVGLYIHFDQPLHPEELAHFFVFLCSPRASYCVGSTYYVDGGWLKVIT